MVQQVFWQAHRGGGVEAPDNTMAANRYSWELGGIPEADVRTTKDGVIICLHDETLARTTTAPVEIKNIPVSDLEFEEIRKWDAGVRAGKQWEGEVVPSLVEMFAEMQGRPERMAYLDLKNVDLVQLGALIEEYQVNRQVIFTHNVQDNCRTMKRIAADVRTMLWIGGKPEQIMAKYREARDAGFDGLDQVQLHLSGESNQAWPYLLDQGFVAEAVAETRSAGIDLEVLPFQFHTTSIHRLLDIGVRWFATDEPAIFLDCVNRYHSS